MVVPAGCDRERLDHPGMDGAAVSWRGHGTIERADGDFEEVGGVSSLYSTRSMHI